jgi:hypothetical protein
MLRISTPTCSCAPPDGQNNTSIRPAELGITLTHAHGFSEPGIARHVVTSVLEQKAFPR